MGLKNTLKGGSEIYRGVLLAHFILLLHVFIIAALGLLVLVLGGLARHLLWLFIFGTIAVIASAYVFYRRMKSRGQPGAGEVDRSLLLGQRQVEIRIFGGLISLRLKPTQDIPELDMTNPADVPRLVEGPQDLYQKELDQLAQLLEKNIISAQEYHQAKLRLVNRQTDKSPPPT